MNLAVGDTAKVGDAREVTLYGVRFSSGESFLSPDQGNVYVIVDVGVRNTGDDEYNMSSLLQLAARDGDGREYNITFAGDTQGSLDGTILAAEGTQG